MYRHRPNCFKRNGEQVTTATGDQLISLNTYYRSHHTTKYCFAISSAITFNCNGAK